MCGISGLFAPSLDRATRHAACARMVGALEHRGPDAQGIYEAPEGAVVLGHNRLSILDLSPTGAQPMSNEGDRQVIAFNGEVYNFPDLRRELEGRRRFRGHSDTEVVLAAWEKWGPGAFRRFNGMFAAAILDREAGTLTLVRDRLGIKPLYIGREADRVVFASEIKAILASGLVGSSHDPRWLGEFLYFGNTLGTHTLYHNITQLPPGHYLEIDLASGRVGDPVSYWDANELPTISGMSQADAIEQTRTLLERAVQRQLASDVPVGAFLSGGVDSSAIVALASRHYAGRLRTYTVGFDYADHADELPMARMVADRFGTEHHELPVSAGGTQDAILALAEAHDQPFADAANLPLFQLCRALGGETKVILQGDGGDELFGGYRRYPYLRAGVAGRVLARAATGLLAPLGAAQPGRWAGPQRFFGALAKADRAERMALLLTVEGHRNTPLAVLNHAIRAEVAAHDPFARYRVLAAETARLPDLQAMLRTDLKILLPDIFLQKVDRSTMACSIEVRVPFLDFDLVDFVGALPGPMKVGARQKKMLLRQALEGIVPAEVLHGPKKGFGVPVASWLAGPLHDFARDRILAQAKPGGWFAAPAIERLFAEHASRRRDHSQILWKSLQLALWLERPLPPARA